MSERRLWVIWAITVVAACVLGVAAEHYGEQRYRAKYPEVAIPKQMVCGDASGKKSYCFLPDSYTFVLPDAAPVQPTATATTSKEAGLTWCEKNSTEPCGMPFADKEEQDNHQRQLEAIERDLYADCRNEPDGTLALPLVGCNYDFGPESATQNGEPTMRQRVEKLEKQLAALQPALTSNRRSEIAAKAGTGVLSTVDEIPFFLQEKLPKPFISGDLIRSTKVVFYTKVPE